MNPGRVLLLTGRRAADIVRRAASDYDWADVKVLPIEVAALMTTSFILDNLSKEDVDGYDLVLVPGLFRGNVRELDERLEADFRLSTREARDLPVLLEEMEKGFEPSKDVPACVLLRERLLDRVGRVIEEAEGEIPDDAWVDVGPVRVAPGCRPRVLSEVFCDGREPEDVAVEASRRVDHGAEIVDLGFHEEDPERAAAVAEAVIDRVGGDAAISVDTGDPDVMEAVLSEGAHMILSAFPDFREPLELARDYDVPVVICPSSRDPKKAVAELSDLLRSCDRMGVKAVVDPLLDPPWSVVESVVRFKEVVEHIDDVPTFFGAGNVFELIDADSTGAAALCAVMAVELGASIVFTPEAGGKTAGSTLELAIASRMAYAAEKTGGFPKDLGLDLLVFKSKHRPWNGSGSGEGTSPAGMSPPRSPDPAGYVRIEVDHEGGVLKVTHVGTDGERLTLEGEDGLEIAMALIGLGLVSRLDHAAYLGYELARAEACLKGFRVYVQDEPEGFYVDKLEDLRRLG
ncbi:MAG: dihydropteroate synthase-like protein [Methanopyri archaeon]|nr:dihydropteroate synthase-like protein [Methanopyri archaeon]